MACDAWVKPVIFLLYYYVDAVRLRSIAVILSNYKKPSKNIFRLATHISKGVRLIIDSDNDVSPVRRQASIWTTGGLLLITAFGTQFSEILNQIGILPRKTIWKCHLQNIDQKCQPRCVQVAVTTKLDRYIALVHDDVIKWKHFPRYWPFVRVINRSRTKPVTRSFDVFFDLRLNKRLSKQSRGWWFETPSRSLWRHCNELRDRASQQQSALKIRAFDCIVCYENF